MEIYLVTNACLNIQFRNQRHVGWFESKCFTLTVNGELTCSSESVATGKFESVVHSCKNGWRCGTQQLILLLSCTVVHKICADCYVDQHREDDIYV